MNKLLMTTIAAAALTTPVFAAKQAATNDLDLSAKFAYASHHVVNGMQHQQSNTNATIKAEYAFPAQGDFATDVAVELFYMSPITKRFNQADLTASSRTWWANEYFIDCGYTYTDYANGKGDKQLAAAWEMNRAVLNRQNTVFLGIGRDVDIIEGEEWSRIILAGTVSYAFNTEDFVVKASLEKVFENAIVNNLDLSFKVLYGYSNAGDYFGKGSNISNDYGFVGASVEAKYHLTQTVNAVFGVAYDYNNEKSDWNNHESRSTWTVAAGLEFRY